MASVADKATLGRIFSIMVFLSVSLTSTPYLHSYISLVYYGQYSIVATVRITK